MSTTGIDSWAVDLKDIGAIYPFQGTEFALVVIGVVFWICWHIWQIKHETTVYKEQKERLQNKDVLLKAMQERKLD